MLIINVFYLLASPISAVRGYRDLGEKPTANVLNSNNIKDNDNILIVEACNHDRKCNDIATVQLPNAIKKYTQKNVNFDFNFER